MNYVHWMAVVERTHASGILLPVEARSHLAPCHLGLSDCPCFFLDPRSFTLRCAQKERYSVRLDVYLFCRFHRCVRRQPCDGGVDTLGSLLLAFRWSQANHGLSLSANGGFPRTSHAGGAESPDGNEPGK